MTVGHSYKKKQKQCHRIASLLDYETLYLEKINEIDSLRQFVDALNNCLAACDIPLETELAAV